MALTKTPVCDFGKKAEDFKLKSINNKFVTLNDIKGEKATLVMFICNHCPYVKAVIKDIVNDANNLKNLNVNTIAIMSNDTKNYPDDSFENMAKRANKGMPYAYLFDETQEVATAYGAERTPEFYLLNGDGVVVYRGRMDNSPRDPNGASTSELSDALDSLSMGEKPAIERTQSIGCSVKWKY